jgi:hypothetical protein
MGNDKASLGKISLWTSIADTRMGTGPPTPATKAAGWSLAIGGLLFVMLQSVAFGCGIAARRTATGKGGLVISGVLLLFGLGVIAWIVHIAMWS